MQVDGLVSLAHQLSRLSAEVGKSTRETGSHLWVQLFPLSQDKMFLWLLNNMSPCRNVYINIDTHMCLIKQSKPENPWSCSTDRFTMLLCVWNYSRYVEIPSHWKHTSTDVPISHCNLPKDTCTCLNVFPSTYQPTLLCPKKAQINAVSGPLCLLIAPSYACPPACPITSSIPWSRTISSGVLQWSGFLYHTPVLNFFHHTYPYMKSSLITCLCMHHLSPSTDL